MSKERLRLLLKIGLGVALVMIVVSIYEIWNISNQYKESKDKYDKLETMVQVQVNEPQAVESTRSLVVESEPEEEEESMINLDFDMDFDALREINPDFIGWIYYEPFEISYPIVEDRGDDYYEHYSFDLTKNVAGAIFMDYACRTDMGSFNTIIYGHNMRNGSMFGSLKKLLSDPSIIDEYPYFYFITDTDIYMYRIFATYLSATNSPTYDLKLEYTLDEKKEYIDYIESKAEYKFDEFFEKELTDDVKIATLSTCHGLHSSNRTVIHGELIAKESR